MAKIEFRDWETWKKATNAKSLDADINNYLRDHNRVKGAGVRIFQYLVMPRPRQSSPPVAYDFFAQDNFVRLHEYLHPNSVTLIRCQQKRPLNISEDKPSFTYHAADYPVEKFLSILEDLQTLSLPNVFKNLPYIDGYDGDDYEFAYNTPREAINAPLSTYLRYYWWSEPSPALLPLANYWAQLTPSLDRLLDS